MNPKITSLAALLGVAALSLTSSPALAGKLLFADNPIEGRYIVVLKDDAARLADEGRSNKPDVADVALDLSQTYRLDLEHSYTHVLRGFVATASDRALQELLLDDRIAYVEEDGVVRTSQAIQPNPPWGLDRIDQRYLPLDGMYVYDTMASNVNVYIIDTGIRANHVEFGGRVQSGYSTVDDGNGSDDCNGHGTHVAGIAGAVTYGVAKAVRLYPVRVLNCNGSGSN